MRVLIVEDEQLIREGLLSMVDWAAEGFDEAAGCESAVEALELLSDRGADLVITDLYMQALSGLEMIEMARGMEINAQFVILTGHGKFEYAQKAVELGVKRFLTKPIQPEALRELLREMRQEILEQHRIARTLEESREKLREYHPVVCRQFWQALVGEHAPGELEAQRLAALYDVPVPDGPLACLTFGVAETGLSLHFRVKMRQVVEELLGNRLVSLLDLGENLLAVISGQLPEGELSSFPAIMSAGLGMTTWIGVGQRREGLGRLHLSAREATDALKAAQGTEATIFYFQDIKSLAGEETPYPTALEEAVLEAARYRDAPDEAALEHFLDAVYEAPVRQRGLMLLRFQVALYRVAESYGVSLPPFQPTLQAGGKPEEARRFLELLEETARQKSGSRQRAMVRVVEDAKRIMEEGFRDPDLNISGIARQLFISPQYLSRLFRTVTGLTCMAYLTAVRINAARELLQGSGEKSYEIARQVGYQNPNYFSALFKRHVGMTPKQYRMENQ